LRRCATLVAEGDEVAGSIPAGPTLITAVRRALVALGVAGLVAAVLRLRGSGGTPPESGGWRELSGNDLR
jgi:hypothetical protein